jgi:hypothetical protein
LTVFPALHVGMPKSVYLVFLDLGQFFYPQAGLQLQTS